MRHFILYIICCNLFFLTTAQTVKGPAGEMFTRRIVSSNLSDPWEISWGPDNFLWVTEARGYTMSRINPANGSKSVLLDLTAERNFPRYDRMQAASGGKPWSQGGLMGFALHPLLLGDKPYVYLAYHYQFAGAGDSGRGCKLNFGGCYFTVKIVRYEYDRQARKLVHPFTLCDTVPASNDHNGGRMLIAPVNGKPYLFYTIGDMGAGQFDNAGRPNHAQQPEVYEGKILRFNLEPDRDTGRYDCWIPNDNPFNATVQSAVFSYGHRNPQGLAYLATGRGTLFSSEHGPFSDDEINIIEKGKNYGHPLVIGYADGNYDSLASNTTAFTQLPGPWHTSYPLIVSERENARMLGAGYRDPLISLYPNSYAYLRPFFEQLRAGGPRHPWPSEAPSSLDIYTADAIPGWKNSLLLPSLKNGHLVRLKLSTDGQKITGDTLMYFKEPVRYRDLAISADGKSIYLASDSAAISSGPSKADPQQTSCTGCIVEYRYVEVQNAAAVRARKVKPARLPDR